MLDGIYAGEEQVFRFYPDGLVLDVLVRPAATPQSGALIATWLRREDPPASVHTARYTRDGGAYTFETRGHLRDEQVVVQVTKAKDHLVVDRRDGGRPRRNLRFDRIFP
ncbi:hypothetical protein [Nonomuraea endophytica]|uniref:Uncharacterized protein n=1 Tax=Nonomuraea endophytica TaxID=714136 RepID=A0A7W7ZX87_9ACTN|nr:hypothetical protein [Nonomuraea endophytica]MBB5075496.1 hypothetical protein [Nonomuraea endophytica]